MRFNLKIISILFIIINSCNIQKSDRKTEIFSNYLQKEFNVKIPDSLHYYIIIPEYGCKGCMQRIVKLSVERIEDDIRKHVTFILSNRDEIISFDLFQDYKLLHDKDQVIDYLALNIANVTIIVTRKEKVTKIINVNDEKTMLSFCEEMNNRKV